MADARDDSSTSSTPLSPSPTLVPIPPAEYADYYFQRDERLFPRHRLPPNLRNVPDIQLPSVLPVDEEEMERRVVQHNLVSLALQQHWFGPFEEHLTPPEDKIVLDIGSASGKWIEDVSEEEPYQDVHFHGVEIVPLSPTEQTEQTVFEVYDFQQEGIRQRDASVDVIHARFQNFHILDWDAFLRDSARALKPGGLFMSGELDIALESPDDQPLNAPATNQFYNQVQRLMRERGYTPEIGSEMPNRLRDIRDSEGVALFTNVGSDVITFPMSCSNPIVEQREISVLSMECLDSLAQSLRPFLLSTGQAPVEVDGLLREHRGELRTISAQMKYRIAWAERR